MKFKDMQPGEFGCTKIQYPRYEDCLVFIKTNELYRSPVPPFTSYDEINGKVLVNAVDLDTGQTLRIDGNKSVILIDKQPLVKALRK